MVKSLYVVLRHTPPLAAPRKSTLPGPAGYPRRMANESIIYESGSHQNSIYSLKRPFRGSQTLADKRLK